MKSIIYISVIFAFNFIEIEILPKAQTFIVLGKKLESHAQSNIISAQKFE